MSMSYTRPNQWSLTLLISDPIDFEIQQQGNGLYAADVTVDMRERVCQAQPDRATQT
jgi:hypothetical protein